MRARRGLLDWRMAAALAALLLVAVIGYDIYAKGQRVDQLVHQLQTERADASVARAAAARERDRLLANQRRLLRQLAHTNAELRQLRRYVATQLHLPGIPTERAGRFRLPPSTSSVSGPQSDPRHPRHGAAAGSEPPAGAADLPAPAGGTTPTPTPAPQQPSNPLGPLLDPLRGLLP